MKPIRPKKLLRYVIILPSLILIMAFFIAPYTNMVITSFKPPGRESADGFTFANYIKGVTDGYYVKVLLFTLMLGAITTLSTLLLGYPLAYHLAQRETKYKAALFIMVLSPLLTDVVIRCYGWMLLLGDRGLINNALMNMGLLDMPLPLMYNVGGVYFGEILVGYGILYFSLDHHINDLIGSHHLFHRAGQARIEITYIVNQIATNEGSGGDVDASFHNRLLIENFGIRASGRFIHRHPQPFGDIGITGAHQGHFRRAVGIVGGFHVHV